MRGKLNLKLLCFLIISFFMIGIGGVKASTITINSIEWLGNYQTARYAKFNVTLDGTTSRYAYCLDAPLDAPNSGATFGSSTLLSAETRLRMINVLVAAGYPAYNLTYTDGGTMTDADAFYVTQAALWYARYGAAATYRTFTPNFHQKMKNGTYGLYKYKTAYNKLIAAADNKNAYSGNSTQIELSSDNGNTMSESTIGTNKVLVSNSTFSVNVASRIDVTGTNALIYSEDLTQSYGTSKNVNKDEEFKIVIDVDDSASASEYNASFSVTELNPVSEYELLTFPGYTVQSGFQSMALLLPLGSTPANLDYSLKGNTENHEYDVAFAKVNEDGDYLGGTLLAIYTENDEFIRQFYSSSEGPKTGIKLVPGNYYLKEITNPSGYTLNTTPVNFTVGNDGQITVGGNEVDVVSISDENAYISFKKVDIDGNAVEGATFVIYNRLSDGTLKSDNYICGKTDSEGYLTQTSSACNNIGTTYGTNNIISSTGVYKLTDLDYSNFPSYGRLYVKELEAAYGFDKDDDEYILVGPIQDSFGYYSGGNPGDVIQNTRDGKTVTEFQFKDTRYINISKVDSIGGEEIEGATLRICIKNSATGKCEVKGTGEDKQPDYVDSWVSGTEPHKFSGIKKDVRYILEEVYAPEQYEILFSGMLEFELVDDEGTVRMYNHETGEEIDNPEKLKAVMPNKPITQVTISKTSAVGGEEIPGANIKICTEDAFNDALNTTGDGNNCTATEEWTSGTTPHTVTGLGYGKYRLVETIAPAGYYSKTSSVPFEIKIDGKIVSVTMTNDVTKLTISKKNQITNERIAGAKLEIIDLETSAIAKDYKGNELVWESKLDEDWVIYGIPGGKKYKLIETITPEGYQEGMIIDGQVVNEYEFYIGNTDQDVNIDLNLEVLNAPNTGISTLNLFAIGGLMVFAGYETIKIYRRKALNN